MVTNLPEAAKSQWKKVVEARNPEQKLKELKKFLSMVPKHKGTKNLIKQCKRQMAKLREEIEYKKRRKTGIYITNWLKSKHGEGRISIIGYDHDLIRSLFNYLSHKKMDNYPFWLYEPFYSIYEVNNIQFQLVSLPPLGIKDSLDYKIYNYLKTSDFILGIFPPNMSPKNFIKELRKKGINVSSKKSAIKIIKTPSGGIRMVGVYQGSYKQLKNLLNEYRIYNAIIKISDTADLEAVENAILDIFINVPGILVDMTRQPPRYYRIKDSEALKPKILNKENLLKEVLDALELIRVYTSPDGKEISKKPVLTKKGSTVFDLARQLHKDLVNKFKYAYVIRHGNKIRVSKNFTLMDEDIVYVLT